MALVFSGGLGVEASKSVSSSGRLVKLEYLVLIMNLVDINIP